MKWCPVQNAFSYLYSFSSYNTIVPYKKIKINNLLTNAEVINGVETLKTGDKIYCYLFETSSNYDAVEIKAEKTILSLEQYNKTYSNQGILGIVIMPIGFVICLTLAIMCLFAKFKEKENIANEE